MEINIDKIGKLINKVEAVITFTEQIKQGKANFHPKVSLYH
jgi:hypothetical protein